jgi:hypothetical protein
MGLVPRRLDLQCKSSLILNDFFTENFRGIGMCLSFFLSFNLTSILGPELQPLVLLERS